MNVRQILPRDAIPSVDDPTFSSPEEGRPNEEVIVLDSTPPRAYPVRYLDYHEIVNDVVTLDGEDRPVAVTWCPLCGSAVAFDRRIDGQTLTFGVSGKLADDDLVMYDRETESEWKQSLGEAIAGPLAGESLLVLPASMTTLKRFREKAPDGLVLDPPGGESEAASDDDEPAPIDYDGEPYRRYFEMDGFGLDAHRGGKSREWDRDDIDPKAIVLGLEREGDAVGVPLPVVEDAGGVVELSVGDVHAAVFATPDGIHAFESSQHTFESTSDPDRFTADGTTWSGSTGESDDGRSLERLPARRLFAFAWQDDHGEDSFFLNGPD